MVGKGNGEKDPRDENRQAMFGLPGCFWGRPCSRTSCAANRVHAQDYCLAWGSLQPSGCRGVAAPTPRKPSLSWPLASAAQHATWGRWGPPAAPSKPMQVFPALTDATLSADRLGVFAALLTLTFILTPSASPCTHTCSLPGHYLPGFQVSL